TKSVRPFSAIDGPLAGPRSSAARLVSSAGRAQRGKVEQMCAPNRSLRVRSVWPAWLLCAPIALVLLCVATTAFAAPGPPDPQAGTIQAVIEHANQEQAQAL